MIIASPNLVFTDAPEIGPNSPLLNWHNVITVNNVAADSEHVDYPVVNLANPATDLLWKSTSLLTQYITVNTTAMGSLDYIGIARHNFGSTATTLSVEVDSGSGFVQVLPPFIPGDDEPLLLKWVPVSGVSVRLKIVPNGALVYAAVMFLGLSLHLQRRIYVGHTPIKYGRRVQVVTGMSENGNFLGRVITGESRATTIELKNLTAVWYRDKLEKFIERYADRTFFWAWRPQSYPNEVGYCWVTGDPQPTNQKPNGMMEITIPIGGISK